MEGKKISQPPIQQTLHLFVSINHHQHCLLDLVWAEQKEEGKNLTVGEKLKRGGNERAVGASAAGIGGLMRKQRQNNEHADKSIDVAFKDLSALIEKARDMVSLSNKLKVALEENQKKGENTEREDKGIEQFLLTLGIASPVTKTTAEPPKRSQPPPPSN